MDTEDMQGKTVLVFLKPQNPQRNYMIHAWQTISGTAGSTESFSFDYEMSPIDGNISKSLLPPHS